MSNASNVGQTQDFSKLRKIFWPVHNYELKKVLPMAFIMFCILFNYTVMRDTKDALIVTAGAAGADAIPYLKGICVTLSAILFMILYIKASNVFSKENLFYVTVTPFLVFFGVFAFIIYPNKELLHPALDAVNALKTEYPRLEGLFAIYGVWTYALFYTFSEIWGSVGISLLFWQFANEVTRINEAKRFYTLFGLFGNLALIFSGEAVTYLSEIRSHFPPEVDAWAISLQWLMSLVVIMGVLAMLTYRWMFKNVLTNPLYYDAAEQAGKPKKAKHKMSLGESFKLILSSPYIGLIAMLMLAYGITINLIEVTWKGQLGIQFPNPNEYNGFMGRVSFWTGLATMIMMVVGGNVIRAFGWFTSALLTPLMVLIGGGLFFVFIIFRDHAAGILENIGMTPVYASVMLGLFIIVMSKATKYSLFDTTKEMAYIPLDDDLKVKGKAAVDVVGGRMGKAGGSYTFMALKAALPGLSLIALSPYSFVMFLVVTVLWLMSVVGLNKRVEVAVAAKNAEKK